MGAWVNTVHILHNHIKLQLNQRKLSFRTIRKQTEQKSYNYRLKEATTSRLAGGMGWKWLVPYPHVVDKNRRDSLGMRSPSRTLGPLPRVLLPEDVSITSGYKKRMGIKAVEDRNFWSPRQFLLKGPCSDLLRLNPTKLQHGGSRLKGSRHIWGGTELSDIRAELGTIFSQKEVLVKAVVPFLSPFPTEPQTWQVDAISEIPSWLTPFAPPS